jgi:hypothetical protein
VQQYCSLLFINHLISNKIKISQAFNKRVTNQFIRRNMLSTHKPASTTPTNGVAPQGEIDFLTFGDPARDTMVT